MKSERPWIEMEPSKQGPTIADLWRYLTAPVYVWDNAIDWPPDAFALCAAVLRRSGAYAAAEKIKGDPDGLVDAGKAWALRVAGLQPNERSWETVHRAWNRLLAKPNLDRPINLIADDSMLLKDLLFLMGAADEAFREFGSMPHQELGIRDKVEKLIRPTHFGSTLCKIISPTAGRVLPKVHTPKPGLTIRSFSHYLSYCETDEVQPQWYVIPSAGGDVKNVFHLNVLIVPFPEEVRPQQVQAKKELPNIAGQFFEYNPVDSQRTAADRVAMLCKEAIKLTGSLDAVVMPELALTVDDYIAVRDVVLGLGLVSVIGVGGKDTSGRDENRLCIDVPLSPHHYVHLRQRKHHRWRLDRNQIEQYGLAARLDREKCYWEDIELWDRKLMFLHLRPWLITCAVICEDLARHDPIGELIRGVGPHLVIALLMDGPQLDSRWSSRYATSLADDPGSSVLSVTSLGMSMLSRARDGRKGSRVVALWRDSNKGTREIELPLGHEAIVLTLCCDQDLEVSADDRTRRGQGDTYHVRGAYTTVLAGWHPVKPCEQHSGLKPDVRPQRPVPVGAHEASVLAQLAQHWSPASGLPIHTPHQRPDALSELEGDSALIGIALWEILATWQEKEDDSQDYERFKERFLRDEPSKTEGALNEELDRQTNARRTALAIHEWARTNRNALRDADHQRNCVTPGVTGC